MRAGQYIDCGSYRAFVPAPLPPDPALAIDVELLDLLGKAERWLGNLNGAASKLPNVDLFVLMYVRQEAVLSAQIEGTQSTLEDALQFEVEGNIHQGIPADVREITNYIAAMNYGLEGLEDTPLSLRLVRQIHKQLLVGTRGGGHSLGEFRTGQNHIGPAGGNLATATFVPPPVPYMHQALSDFEKFLHDRSLPDLIHCGLAHAQFETIHPFWDGNGRLGRLLITFLLAQREVMKHPLLYLSHYIKAHKAQYYDRLMGIRNDGDWEGWLKFFLRGIVEVSQAATGTTNAILDLRERHRHLVSEEMGGSAYALPLLDLLFKYPYVSVRLVEDRLGCNNVTAANLIRRFETLDLLHEITGGRRNRLYRYGDYLDLFESQGNVSTEGPAA